jgi:UDP-glucose 4-epimerase
MVGSMKILVTGSAGFIGTNLMAMLGDRGVPFDLFQGHDTRSPTDVGKALEGVDTVVHLAAVTGVEQSVRFPVSSFDNVVSVQNLLDGCRRVGAAFFMASTAGALSGPPRSPYAASKVAGEAYCNAYAWSYGMRTTVLRLGNVYGPWSGQKQTVIPALCKALLAGTPFRLYGDGCQKRDFIYVEDVCRGIVQAVEHGAEGQFNLASGKLTRLNKLIDIMAKVSGSKPNVVPMSPRQGEAQPERIGITAAREEFDFQPSTSLEDGLKLTWDWFRTNPTVVSALVATPLSR